MGLDHVLLTTKVDISVKIHNYEGRIQNVSKVQGRSLNTMEVKSKSGKESMLGL